MFDHSCESDKLRLDITYNDGRLIDQQKFDICYELEELLKFNFFL